ESRGALDVRILQMTITPMYVTLAATVIVWGYFISTAFAAVAIGSVLAAAMAYAVRLILWAAYEWLLEALRGVWAALWGLLPQTVERWGEWSIAAAFVLLLAGAALSFGRRGSSTGV
ncbi:MAG TPA: hypothetical protein VHM90_13900, partial [Phycisphaerae bacterium]|nr:hypothetical protein [Phycisphaerae bacterium]